MNVCIVGYGAVGPIHAEALSMIDNVHLYGICDVDKKRAQEGATQYQCQAFYGLEECLRNDDIECIHLCIPHYLHFPMIEQCLKAGKRVVVEKPIVMKEEELSRLLTDYPDAPVFPVMQNRTNTCVRQLKTIIDTERLGNLKTARGIVTWHKDEAYYNSANWRGTKAFEGGGVLINQAIHTLDLLVYLGGTIDAVNATVSNKSLGEIIEVEDTVDAYLQFSNGATGIFYATNAHGENSSVLLELSYENDLFRYIDGKLYRNETLICEDEMVCLGKSYWGSGHERLLDDLYKNDKAIKVADIKDTMQTMFAIYRSAELQKLQRILVGKEDKYDT